MAKKLGEDLESRLDWYYISRRGVYRVIAGFVAVAALVVGGIWYATREDSGPATRAREATAVFQISKKLIYACMPVGSPVMVAYSVVFVVKADGSVVGTALVAFRAGRHCASVAETVDCAPFTTRFRKAGRRP